MTPVAQPVSRAWIAGLALVVALAAVAAVAGLALSDSGDDAERIAYLVSLALATVTALSLVALARRREVELTRLRADAAVVVYCLRVQAAQLAQVSALPATLLARTLRESVRLGAGARETVETLIDAGAAQEAIELRVAIEALEYALDAASEAR